MSQPEPEVTQTGDNQHHGVSFTRLYQRASGNAFLGFLFLLLAALLIIPLFIIALVFTLLFVLFPPLKTKVNGWLGKKKSRMPGTRAPGEGDVIDVEVTNSR